jgi:hypothetical protein
MCFDVFACTHRLAMERIKTMKSLGNIQNLLIVKNILEVLRPIIFFCITFFLCACNSKNTLCYSSCLTKEERSHLEHFFQYLLFENYGAFVIFGSKPLCEMDLHDTEFEPSEEKIDELNLYRGMLAWEKVQKTFKMKRYILAVNSSLGSGRHNIIFADIQKTAITLAKYSHFFQSSLGIDFEPLQITLELSDPTSKIRDIIYNSKDYVAKGLLFGFGLENSMFFSWWIKYLHPENLTPNAKEISEYLQGAYFPLSTRPLELRTGSLSHFTIPVFREIANDHVAGTYEKEKKMIEKLYRGQDLVEYTLKQLAR